jgi:hypothetical protein
VAVCAGCTIPQAASRRVKRVKPRILRMSYSWDIKTFSVDALKYTDDPVTTQAARVTGWSSSVFIWIHPEKQASPFFKLCRLEVL